MLLLTLLWCTRVASSPWPLDPENPIITPSPSLSEPSRTWEVKRDLLPDIAGDVSSVLGGLGSSVPGYVASGVPDFFQNFPTGSSVQSSLGLDDAQVAALPSQVLNIPSVFPTVGAFKTRVRLTSVGHMGTIQTKGGRLGFVPMSSSSPTSLSPS